MAAESFISANPGQVVFLDRDGVINRQAPPHEYIRSWDEFIFLPGVVDAIHRLNSVGYTILVVSNQRGVARGMLTLRQVDELHSRMCAELEKHQAHISGIFVCPHEQGTCTCRKPEIGLFFQAERNFQVDKARSWMVGDSESDMLAGLRYGVRTILIGNREYGQDFTAKNLSSAVDIIVGGYGK